MWKIRTLSIEVMTMFTWVAWEIHASLSDCETENPILMRAWNQQTNEITNEIPFHMFGT